MQPLFVLIHSPSVGPATWRPVADHLNAAGHQALVPSLPHIATSSPPFWSQIVRTVRDELRQFPAGTPVTLVAHSNAGLFLPSIRSGLDQPVSSSIFVDAALPARTGPTPVASPETLGFLRPLAVRGRLPRWTDWWDEADIAPMFPDSAVRQTVTEEQPRLPLSYFEQRIPALGESVDRPCSYLLFSSPYDEIATEAHERGWQVARLPGTHLQQLVDPAGTARHLVELATAT